MEEEPMSVIDAPIKVAKTTKERIRLGAALLSCTQGELVDRAVADYLERNAGRLSERVDAAREALLGGDDAVIAYMLGAEVEDVQRVSG